MRKRIVIRLPGCGRTQTSWVVWDGSQEGPSMIKAGTLEEAAQAAEGARVIAVVPAAEVLLAPATVPTTNRRRLLSAIPYALEDQLAQDVDTLHFAVGARAAGNQVNTAVVALADMQRWIDELVACGVQPDAMFPESLCLPVEDNQWTLLLEDEGAVLRTGKQMGMSLDSENVETLVPLIVESAEADKPEKLLVIDCRGSTPQPVAFELDLELEHRYVNEPAVELLAAGVDEKTGLDLLQGEFSRREQLGKYWRPWLPAAGMVAGLIMIQLGYTLAQQFHLNRQVEGLRTEARDLYFKTFPESKRLVPGGERSQMQAKLNELRGGGASGGEFVGLLSSVGEQFSKTPGLELDRINYRAGQLNVSFKIPDLQKLDELKQQLATQTGLNIDIQSATSRGGKVEALLQIAGSGT